MHIAQHVFDGVVGLDTGVVNTTVRVLVDVHRVGVTEQVVHVAENLLVGTNQENSQQVVLTLIDPVHRQAGFDALLVDVLIDLAVRVAGQVLQYRTTHRLFVQTVQRQDRQDLADGPGVRQALEHREVADVLVGKLVVELIEHLAMRALAGLERVMQASADGEVALLGQGFLSQGDLAIRVLSRHVTHVVGRTPVGLGDHLDISRAEQVSQPLHRLRQAFLVLDYRHFVVVLLDVGNLHHQHGVVGGQRAATLGEDVRMRQALSIAELFQHTDHDTGVVVHVVVDRAGVARVGTVVVNTQATTDVDVIDWQVQGTQFAIVANRFFETVLVVSQVGDLRPHVEVQQANTLVQTGITEALNHRDQLGCRQAKLGLLATGISPLARCQRRQAHAQTNLRLDLELSRFLDHQGHFRLFLDDDEHVVTQLLAHQREANELTVLVAVADDRAAFWCQGQNSQQLRLGTGLKANRDVLGGDDVLHHRFLLVNLDRIQRGVLALILQARDVGIKGTGQLAHAVLQDVGETHQQRQRQAALAQLVDLFVQINRRAARPIRANFDAAGLVDCEVTGPPMANPVNTAAVRNCPLAAIVFACASYGH
ncbi:hypothetical protein D3C77_276610 [compost metagenome]